MSGGRLLAWAVAVAIFLGAGGYTFMLLDAKSYEVAESVGEACYARHGVDPAQAADAPQAVQRPCNRPIRDYESGRIWRAVMAASVGATAAMLLVGGLFIIFGAKARSGS